MPKFIAISGPIVADTVYVDNSLVARDVSATLPEVTPTTVDVQALGTMSLPVWQLIENLEMAITKIGIDMGLRSMIQPKPLGLELRGVQTVTDAGGNTSNQGIKASCRGIPNKIPEIGFEIGSAPESECTFMLTRYQLIVDGAEMFLIDRLAGILRIAGVDYAAALNNLL